MSGQGFLLCRFSILWIWAFGHEEFYFVHFKSGTVHVLNVKDSIKHRAGISCVTHSKFSLLPKYLLIGSNK